MKIFYLSEKRFIARIIKRWKKRQFRYNAGHVQLLEYSFRAILFWSGVERQRVSKINKNKNNLKLF